VTNHRIGSDTIGIHFSMVTGYVRVPSQWKKKIWVTLIKNTLYSSRSSDAQTLLRRFSWFRRRDIK